MEHNVCLHSKAGALLQHKVWSRCARVFRASVAARGTQGVKGVVKGLFRILSSSGAGRSGVTVAIAGCRIAQSFAAVSCASASGY